MRIVCILGESETRNIEVELNLERLGYNRLISYTTRKPKVGEVNGVDYYFVDRKKFDRLKDKDILMEWAERNGEMYGSPHPIGTRNNVVTVGVDSYRSIKSRFRSQVIGVYIGVEQNSSVCNSIVSEAKEIKETKRERLQEIGEDEMDLIVEGQESIESITAKILKQIAETR